MTWLGRVGELRRLEASERALAALYRRQARLRPGAVYLVRLALLMLEHAALLRGQLLRLGVEPLDERDDQWIRGPIDDWETLRRAQYAAKATYHDHLLDHDPEIARLLRDVILRGHTEALDELDAGRLTAPLSEL
jgi:hypothetical protein